MLEWTRWGGTGSLAGVADTAALLLAARRPRVVSRASVLGPLTRAEAEQLAGPTGTIPMVSFELTDFRAPLRRLSSNSGFSRSAAFFLSITVALMWESRTGLGGCEQAGDRAGHGCRSGWSLGRCATGATVEVGLGP